MNNIDITITSYPDQPGLVAELWCEKGMLGEIRYQNDTQSTLFGTICATLSAPLGPSNSAFFPSFSARLA